jgi:hypothetical protein
MSRPGPARYYEPMSSIRQIRTAISAIFACRERIDSGVHSA